MNTWTKVSTLMPALLATLAGCARVTATEEPFDAGPSQPAVASVDPPPGRVAATAHFNIRFSSVMDVGELISSSGRSESVVLAAAVNTERAAAAIARGHPSAAELALFVPAVAAVAPDQLSLELAPDAPLPPGSFFLLVSPRLKDTAGHKLAGAGARFAFDIDAAPARNPMPRLLTPPAGSTVPLNLLRVRVLATDAGVALVDEGGGVVGGPVTGPGEVFVPCEGLRAGAAYGLAVDGVPVPDAGFLVSSCRRTQPPTISAVSISVLDDSVAADVLLDWPASVRLEVSPLNLPCDAGPCASLTALAECASDACAAQTFFCATTLRLHGLSPASDYTLRVVVQDDEGHTVASPAHLFSTLAPLPRLILSEVMIDAQPSPRARGQFVEILNQGPGAALLDGLALSGPDGISRPLIAVTPPLPLVLAPGGRALVVGASFDAARYPGLPPGTPVLRAATQRLLGHGLSPADPPRLDLMLGRVVLASFPGGPLACDTGQSLQRDEGAAPDAAAKWTCGRLGGTPGSGP